MSCSVVIIARNAEKTIKQCIESVKIQTLPPTEVIVVDNGSIDSTRKIAEAVGVTVLSEPVRGRSKARNAGMLKAQSELIAFIDADATADINWLKNLIETYRGDGFVGVSGSIKASNKNKLIPKLLDIAIENKPHYGTGNILYNRSVIIEAGLFNWRLEAAEDVELAWRIIRKGYKIGFEPEAIVYHRHKENLADFLHQQYDFGQWSMIARKLLRIPTWKQKILIVLAPLTIFKHLVKILKHPLLPLLLTGASIAYAAGLLKGSLAWRSIA